MGKMSKALEILVDGYDTYSFVIRAGDRVSVVPLAHPRVVRASTGTALDCNSSFDIELVSCSGSSIKPGACENAPTGALVVFSHTNGVRTENGFIDIKTGESRPASDGEFQFYSEEWGFLVRQNGWVFEFFVSVLQAPPPIFLTEATATATVAAAIGCT